MIDFGRSYRPRTLLLVNNIEGADQQRYIGNAEFRVGNHNLAFSTINVVVKSGIVDGGTFILDFIEEGRYA